MVNIKGFAAISITGRMAASEGGFADTSISKERNANSSTIAKSVHANLNIVANGSDLSTEGSRNHRRLKIQEISHKKPKV